MRTRMRRMRRYHLHLRRRLPICCVNFCAGYDEDEVASTVDKVLPIDDPARVGLHAGETNEMLRRVVHRRTAATAIRP